MKKLISAVAIISMSTFATAIGQDNQGNNQSTDRNDTVPNRWDRDSSNMKRERDTGVNHDPIDSMASAPQNNSQGNQQVSGSSWNNGGSGNTQTGTNGSPAANRMNDEKTGATTSWPNKKQQQGDRIAMRNNKVYLTRKGKTTILTKSMQLKNGTVVMADGTLKLKDGSTMKLKNGEHIKLEGDNALIDGDNDNSNKQQDGIKTNP